MNKKFMALIIGMFLLIFIPFVYAVPPVTTAFDGINIGLDIQANVLTYYKTNFPAELHFHVLNNSNTVIMTNESVDCMVELTNSDGTVVFEGFPVGHEDHFEVMRNASIVSTSGIYGLTITCNESLTNNGIKTFFFEATTNGMETNYNYLIAMIFMILVFLTLGILIHKDKEKMDDEKYYNRMVTKYQEKNYLKFSMIALWYNMKKNSYVFYYLIGLMIAVIVYDVSVVYSLISVTPILKVLLSIYTWGSLVVGIAMFSNVQEWIMGWKKDLEDINWGDTFGGK